MLRWDSTLGCIRGFSLIVIGKIWFGQIQNSLNLSSLFWIWKLVIVILWILKLESNYWTNVIFFNARAYPGVTTLPMPYYMAHITYLKVIWYKTSLKSTSLNFQSRAPYIILEMSIILKRFVSNGYFGNH